MRRRAAGFTLLEIMVAVAILATTLVILLEIVTNNIGGNLACFNNNPAAQVGDSMGQPNVVAGQKRGECKTA